MIFAFEAPSGNIARVIVLIVGPRIGASINWRDPDPSQVDIAAADAYVIARVKRHLEEQGQEIGTVQSTSRYFGVGEEEKRITAMRQHLGGGLG
jgi:hypothetical protein